MRLEINIGLCFFMGFILTSGWSQTSFYNNNVKVALKGGVTLYIDGDLKHNSNSSNGQFVVLDNGIIKLTGDLINEGSTNLFKSGDLSTVQFSQAGNKSITGNGSGEINFNKVVISDASLITLRRDISFLSDFTFQSGNVFLNGFAAELRLRNGNIFGAGDIEPKIMEEDANNRFYGTSGYLQLSGPVNTGLTTLYTFGNLGAGIRQPGLTQIGLRRGHTSQSIRSSMSIQRYYDMTTPAPIFGNGELEFNYLEGPQSDLAGTGNEADLALFRHRINALGSLDPGVIWRYISEATTNPSANQTSMQNLDSLLTFRWTLQECQRPSVTINASATKACTGSDVTLDAGPSPGWSYLWSTGERTQSIDVSSANSALETYFVIVTNGEGCNNSDTVEITWVEQPTIVFDPSSAAVCAGDSLVIDPVVTGSDLTYSWSSGEDTRSIVHYSDGLGAATYSLTVTASALCDAEESITIDDLSGPPLDLGPDQNICDASTYTIDAGLGSGYSYSWSNGSNQSSITVGISGSYHLRVTDQNTGCRAYDTIDIQFGSLTINVNSQDVSCFGKADGAIQISVVQGTFPFSYIWSDGSTDNQLLGVDVGLYSVTVTDALGCIDSLTDIEVLAPDSLSITPEVTVDFCGLSEGQIILNPSGGSLPYRFEWYDADNNFISSNQDIQGLSKGGYTIHIRDDHDCVYESDVYVSGPDAMLEIEAKIENASCNMNDGSIELLISGGTSPYAIDWITGGSTSEILTGLTSGFYQVMVTDANDCSVTRTFEVEDPINPQLLVDSLKHVSCFGYDDGAVYLSLEGLEGTTPDILWSNGALTQDLAGLEPGIYKVTITVEGACSTLEETFEIEEPAELKNDLVIDSIFCFGQGGDIVTNVTGGVPNYSFQWSTGNHTNHLTNLNPGQYSLTVTDQNGCEIRDTVDLSGPALLEVHLHANEPICPGTQDGEIILDIDGGTGRYRIEWDHGDIGSSPENLSAGIYTVHITDDNGCRIDTAFEVVEWEPIQTQQTIVTPSADGAGDGAIHLEISGGKAPYSFQWSNDSTSQNISGLTEGIYTVLITDARGCQQQFTYEVLDPQSFNVGLATNAISCPGGNDGSMEIIILNGLAPYTILWSDGSTDEKLDHLSAGTYAVTVTDGEGTMRTRSASLLDPVPLEVKASVTDVSFCDPGSGGTIVLSVTGGTRPYSYLWHDGDTTASRNNLLAGLYEVSVMDSLGCIITTTYEIHNVSIAIEDSIIYPSSPEAQDGEIYLQVLSGQGPFQFEWSNGGFSDHIEGLGTGRYEVTITDAVGCSLVDSFDLSATEPLQYMAVIDSLSCHGASNGAISLHLQGGVAPYSVAWAHGPVSETIDSLSAGRYMATISDASGMVLEVVFDLEDPPSIRFTNVEIQSVSCPGVADASISVKATGGSGALSWLWSNNSNSAALDGLKAGVYSLSVADERGCQLDTLFMIEEPDRIKAVFEVTSGGCSSGAGGSIMVSGTGGMPAYQYKWSTGQLGDHIENLLPGLYTVTITDQANCSVSEQVLLDSVPKLDFVGIVKNTNCAGGTDGQIEIQPVGDTTGLTYNWTNGRKTRRISGLHAGTYGVKVTNSIGCSSEAEFEVSSPAALLVNLRTSAAGCIAGKGGSALALVEGGTMPYQYQWSTGARDSIIEDVDAGTYQLEVMDSLGCQVEQEVIVQSSKSSIAPRFLAASPVSAGQQVQFLDVSSPKPDAWLWDFGVDENSTSVMEDPVYSFPAVQGSSSTRYLTTLKISSDQCIGTSAKWIRVISNDLIPDVGVSEDEILLTNIQKWVVYPNPASSFAKVDIVLSKISEVNLRLISLEGKILQQYKLDNNSVYQKELQLGTIPVGTYLLYLQAGKDVKTAKIIIIK